MDWIRDYDFVIIYCRPEDDVIYNFGDREQMEGVIEQRVALVNKWDELVMELSKRGFVILTYDWTKHSLDYLTNIIGGKNL